jgi:glycosyltransferase involved in cell wall biosynthesis
VIVTIPCPSQPVPMGGVTVLYEFANALARRGHEVHVLHARFWGRHIESLDDLSWFTFDPGVRHQVDVGEGFTIPDADVIFGTEAPPSAGLPVLLHQGRHMFPAELEQRLLAHPSLKVCVASWLVQDAIDHGVPASELVHVPLGLDHGTFRVTAGLDDRPVHVGVLFNDHLNKGWMPASAALGVVQRSIPDLRVLVFGRTAPVEALPPWMEFVLAPGQAQLVDEVYNRCRVFVQASKVEGFGFTAVEAMACGCALVTSDNGGSRDYAVHGQTALVSDPTDVGAMAAHVELLLRDDALRRRLAAAGTELVAGFDWDHTGELLEATLLDYVRRPERYLREVRSA